MLARVKCSDYNQLHVAILFISTDQSGHTLFSRARVLTSLNIWWFYIRLINESQASVLARGEWHLLKSVETCVARHSHFRFHSDDNSLCYRILLPAPKHFRIQAKGKTLKWRRKELVRWPYIRSLRLPIDLATELTIEGFECSRNWVRHRWLDYWRVAGGHGVESAPSKISITNKYK